MKRNLTLIERETVITFNEGEKLADIYTHNNRWQQHFEKNLKIKPLFDNGYGGKTYQIEKKRIPLPRKPRKLSAETKKLLSERMRNIHSKGQKHSNIQRSGNEK